MQKRTGSLIGLAAAIMLSLGSICLSFRVWELDWNVPVNFSGDGILLLTLFRSIAENGLKGIWFCDRLGAPDWSALIDVPFLDLDLAGETWLLTRFFSANTVFYLLYLLTYPLAGASMYLLMGKFTKKTPLRVLLSVAYAVTPYHFYRGMGHMTLSHYYTVPLAVLAALLIAEEPFRGIAPERFSRVKKLLLYGGCVLLGFSNVYYAFFGLFCMGIAFLYKLACTKKLSCLWKEAVPLYTVLLCVGISLLPKILYSLKYGENTIAGVRSPVQTEILSLRIIQMLLPPGYSKVGILAKITQHYSAVGMSINENQFAALGLFAAAGFLIACLWVIFRIMQKGKTADTRQRERLNLLSLCILCLVMYSVTGGFSMLFSMLITPEIRCVNRSSVVIACLSLCVLAIVLDALFTKLKGKGLAIGGAVMAAVSVCVGYAEFSWYPTHWQAAAKQTDAVLQSFFAQVEETAGENALIYELPFMQFPEVPPINGMEHYQPALGYLYTDTLRWSYGGVKGRNPAAEQLAIDEGMSEAFLRGILDAGFTGVYIDTKGFADGGAAVNAYYTETLGLTPIVSEDGWLYYYPLDESISQQAGT